MAAENRRRRPLGPHLWRHAPYNDPDGAWIAGRGLRRKAGNA